MTSTQQLSLHPAAANPFQVGDRVVFANRAQNTAGGMAVEAVDVNMFDTRLKVDGAWWSPAAFAPFAPWVQAYKESRDGLAY